MKILIETNQIDPSRFYPTKDGKKYYIYSPDWGFFSKKDAEIISSFLSKNLWNIIRKLE